MVEVTRLHALDEQHGTDTIRADRHFQPHQAARQRSLDQSLHLLMIIERNVSHDFRMFFGKSLDPSVFAVQTSAPMNDNNSSVIQLLRSLRRNDSQAIGKLWARYASRMEGVASRWLTRSVGPLAFDEEDVALSAFYELVTGLDEGRFDSVGSGEELWRLIAVITGRKAAELLRAHGRLKRGGQQEQSVSLNDSGVNVDVFEKDVTPDVAVMMVDELNQLLVALADAELEQLVLMKLDGHSNEEIAAHLNYSRSTIQRMLNRVRATWKELADAEPASV